MTVIAMDNEAMRTPVRTTEIKSSGSVMPESRCCLTLDIALDHLHRTSHLSIGTGDRDLHQLDIFSSHTWGAACVVGRQRRVPGSGYGRVGARFEEPVRRGCLSGIPKHGLGGGLDVLVVVAL